MRKVSQEKADAASEVVFDWEGLPSASESSTSWEGGSMALREERVLYGGSDDSNALAQRLQRRSFELAASTLRLFRTGGTGRYDPGYDVVCKQVIRSATSTGANYRAVCRARSDKEFFAKLSIVVEECDETVYWLALALSTDLPLDKATARALLAEAKELCKIFAKSRATIRKRMSNKK